MSLFESYSWIINLHYRRSKLIWHCSLISQLPTSSLSLIVSFNWRQKDDWFVTGELSSFLLNRYFLYLLYKLNCLKSVTHDSKYRLVSLWGWRTKQNETSTWVFFGKITVTTYTCRYGPVSLDLSTGPRDSPHRRGSGSGTGPLESVSRGLVPDP